MNNPAGYERARMVGWYDPAQLAETGRKTVISTIIGENADPRLVNPAAADGTYFDYSKHLSLDSDGSVQADGAQRNEMWIDYVSDVGDGFNSTYSVACALARENLSAENQNLPRGELLVFGGDGVYPTATTDAYEQRLVRPYQMAFDSGTSPRPATDSANLKYSPHVFALPGNHDWYDSLSAFHKLFCTHVFNRRVFAGRWRTRQKQGYFALKLPQDWWLLGVDLQLSHSIDVSQLQYFESVVTAMKKGDKIILAVPEPYWVNAIKYEGMDPAFAKKERSIERLEEFFEARGISIRAYLAGDIHHYRRFENADGVQKITAGGGGAFLHPTHDFDYRSADKAKPREFKLIRDYPSIADSSRQDWKNFKFALNNKTFGIITAVLYPLIAWLIHGRLDGPFAIKPALAATLNRMIEEPLATFVILALVGALIFFTDTRSKWQKYGGGFLHGLAHLSAIFVLGWLGYFVSQVIVANWGVTSYTLKNVIWFASVVLIPGVGGYFIGAIIMGIYLFISLHFRGRHANEAFSALRIEDYKNFLRLHIDVQGRLTIYPFRIDTVPRKWEPRLEGNVIARFEPVDRPINAELIEKPIVI